MKLAIFLAFAMFLVKGIDCKDEQEKDLNARVSDLERQVKDLECPYGQTKWRRSCYFFGQGLVNWYQAKFKCIFLGGHLVKIGSGSEFNMLRGEANNAGLTGLVWIGANDIDSKGTWRWISDNSLVRSPKSVWLEGEPNDKGDCVALDLDKDGKWRSTWCNDKRRRAQFICEKKTVI